MIIYLLIGIIGGFLSGFMGIGGGIIMDPFMVFFAGVSQHLAQGTSLAVLSVPIVIFGAYQYYLQGNVMKYLWRHEHKNKTEDLEKAFWYLKELIKIKKGKK